MSKQELGPNQLRWIEALESGKYKQGRRCLESSDGKNCCLGVACRLFDAPVVEDDSTSFVIFGTDADCSSGIPPRDIVRKLALRSPGGKIIDGHAIGSALVGANDSGATFTEIAAFCRAHPEAVFTEPR